MAYINHFAAASRPPHPMGMPNLQGFPRGQGPALSDVRHNNPGAEALLPPVPPGISPEQLAAMQSQMTPEMMQKAAQLMQDPEVRKQLAQIETMARNGQLTPEMVNQMMGGLPGGSPLTGMPGMPGADGQRMSMAQLAKIGLLACAIGLPIGKGVDYLIQDVGKREGSLLERMLKGIERFGPVRSLNASLESKMAAARAAVNPAHESMLLRLDSAIPSNKVLENYFTAYLGPKGHLYPEMSRMLRDNPRVLGHLIRAKSEAELTRILESNPIHFMPEEVQAAASQAMNGGSFIERITTPIQNALSRLIPAIKPVMHPSKITIGQLDRLLDKEQLSNVLQKALGHADVARRIKPDDLLKIEQLLTEAPKGAMKGLINHPGDLFHFNLNRIMTDTKLSVLRDELKKVLNLGTDVSYSAFQTALKSESGHKAVLDVIKESSKGLVNGLNVTNKTTLGSLEQQFKSQHVIERLLSKPLKEQGRLAQLLKTPETVGSKLRSTLNGLLKRAKFLRNNHLPVVDAEVAFRDALEARGIGPVGRFLGKIGYYFQRIFEGANFKKLGAKTVTESSPLFGRLLVSLFIFGFAISGYHKAPKESKVARFFDNLASGIGGYFGFEVGRNLIHETGLLTRIPGLAKISTMKFLKVLPFTYGGFLSEVVVPALAASAFGYVAQKISSMIFGNPEKIEQKKLFAEDKSRHLTTQRGLFENINKGNLPPGIVAGVPTFVPSDAALTPQNVKLTPEQIMFNPIYQREHDEVLHGMKHMKEFEQSLWEPNAGHY